MRIDSINGTTVLFADDGMIIKSKVWDELEAKVVELADGDEKDNYYEVSVVQSEEMNS